MATSGSIDYALNARQLCTFACRKINLIGKNQAMSDDVADDAVQELNVMLKGMQKHDVLWARTEGSVALVAGTASYALSPVPYRVFECRLSRSGRDIPMFEMARQEYYDLPLKTSSGVPTQWYQDRQRSTVTVYTWPVLAAGDSGTLKYTYQRMFEDIDSLNNDLDIPQEFTEVIGYLLAARLADSYGRKGPHIDRVIARSEQLLMSQLDANREDFVRFVPSRRHG